MARSASGGLTVIRSDITGIVLAAICLIHVPLGTMLGVYALIILFRKDTEVLFATEARP